MTGTVGIDEAGHVGLPHPGHSCIRVLPLPPASRAPTEPILAAALHKIPVPTPNERRASCQWLQMLLNEQFLRRGVT